MTRFALLALPFILAACAGTAEAPPAGLEARTLSPSGAPMGRDNPTSTYMQPSVGPERRVEPPPPPRRP
jgi:hypothetical protein